RENAGRLDGGVADGWRGNLVAAEIEHARIESSAAYDTIRISGSAPGGVPSRAGGGASCNRLLHQNRVGRHRVQHPDHVRGMRSHVVQFKHEVFAHFVLDTKVPVL